MIQVVQPEIEFSRPGPDAIEAPDACRKRDVERNRLGVDIRPVDKEVTRGMEEFLLDGGPILCVLPPMELAPPDSVGCGPPGEEQVKLGQFIPRVEVPATAEQLPVKRVEIFLRHSNTGID